MINVFVISLFTLFSFIGAKDVKVNVEKSEVTWVGKKVTGQHNGTLRLKSGFLKIDDNGNLTGGRLTMDMTSITCLDLSGEDKGKLEGHLKSDDFFGVKNYPTATFLITKAIPQGSGKYKIIGRMTIKETTEDIRFLVSMQEKKGIMMATADISIDRSRFDVRYGSGSFFDNLGDKTIYDDFDLKVSIIAN